MTLEQLKNHYAKLYTLITFEIQLRQRNGDKYTTTLNQWNQALVAANAIKDELKTHINEPEIAQPVLFEFSEPKELIY